MAKAQTVKKVKGWMVWQLNIDPNEYDDCGEVNCTKLAEDAANEFGLYDGGSEYIIPEWVFDLAVDVTES